MLHNVLDSKSDGHGQCCTADTKLASDLINLPCIDVFPQRALRASAVPRLLDLRLHRLEFFLAANSKHVKQRARSKRPSDLHLAVRPTVCLLVSAAVRPSPTPNSNNATKATTTEIQMFI